MSETEVKKLNMEGWVRMVVGAVVTVVTTWQLFTHEIHGYIDQQAQRISRSVTYEVTGQMLMVMDSLKVELRRDCQCDQQTRKRTR